MKSFEKGDSVECEAFLLLKIKVSHLPIPQYHQAVFVSCSIEANTIFVFSGLEQRHIVWSPPHH